MKVALVHDYLFTYGGAERVLEVLHEIWPDAEVFTAWADFDWIEKEKKDWLDWEIKTSWFQRVPLHKQLCSPLRFLTPLIWRSFDLKDYDVVISSSAWYIPRGVNTKNALHFCYCHTPPRYLYGYPTAREFRKFWLGRLYAGLVNPFMRVYDYQTAQSVDMFISNSKEVKKRIKKFYRRDAEVVYPPVVIKADQQEKTVAGINKIDKFYLMVNRLVRHKNVDLAIKTCIEAEKHLVIAGKGRDQQRLKELAKNSEYIHFLGYVEDQQLVWLYKNCQAVLYLAKEEDFGITPVEAMSYGKPVIAFYSGGVKESVQQDKTGLFIRNLEAADLKTVLDGFQEDEFNSKEIIEDAERFGKECFKNKIKKIVKEEYARIT
jgi:glycosyltransferase involved in cell wall biosynthesis